MSNLSTSDIKRVQSITSLTDVTPEFEEFIASLPIDVRKSLAASRDVPVDLLVFFSASKSCNIRKLVARNDATPEETLLFLLNDRNKGVIGAVVLRCNASQSLSDKCLSHPNGLVRWFLARNTRSDSVLEVLSRDLSYGVRRQVLHNSLTPASVVERLCGDSHPLVAGEAKMLASGETTAEVLREIYNSER